MNIEQDLPIFIKEYSKKTKNVSHLEDTDFFRFFTISMIFPDDRAILTSSLYNSIKKYGMIANPVFIDVLVEIYKNEKEKEIDIILRIFDSDIMNEMDVLKNQINVLEKRLLEKENELELCKQELKKHKQSGVTTKTDTTGSWPIVYHDPRPEEQLLKQLGNFADPDAQNLQKGIVFYVFNHTGSRFEWAVGKKDLEEYRGKFPNQKIVILEFALANASSSEAPQEEVEFQGHRVIKFWFNLKQEFLNIPENNESKKNLDDIRQMKNTPLTGIAK